MKRLMMMVMSSFGVAAAAQAPVQTPLGPDNGFFRPSPDVALTAPNAGAASGTAQQAVPYMTLQSGQSTNLPAAAIPVPALVTPVANAPAVPNPAAQQPQQAAQGAQVAPPTALSGPQLTQATQAWAERQMDRSVAEADREHARAQSAPAGVGAAFDGTTSNENR